jgi:hypothetical protein
MGWRQAADSMRKEHYEYIVREAEHYFRAVQNDVQNKQFYSCVRNLQELSRRAGSIHQLREQLDDRWLRLSRESHEHSLKYATAKDNASFPLATSSDWRDYCIVAQTVINSEVINLGALKG